MSGKPRRAIEKALRETGLPWCIEIGSKHHHVRLNGELIAIMPRAGYGNGGDNGRKLQSVINRIRARSRKP